MDIPQVDWPVELSFLKRQETSLAYRYHQGRDLTIVYTGGFHSNMNGEKANAIFKHAVKEGYSALCFDYSAHGQSDGVFAEGNISIWLADTLHLIDKLTSGDIILCGSSMGGWIAILTALQLANKVKGLVTIATATDMTEKFIWDKCGAEHKSQLLNEGFFKWDSDYDEAPYIISMQLIEDGRKHLLLDNPIKVLCPVRMLHGTADGDIDWQNSLETMNKIESEDIHLKLIKGAGHRLSDPEHIIEILQALDQVCTRS